MHNLVIIIDDDPISLLVCETIMRKQGFAKEVKKFEEAQPALDFLKKHLADGLPLPDFIFLDIQMPMIDGWDFLDMYAALLPESQHAPHVVMLSATFDPEDQRKSEAQHLVKHFLSKPISVAALDLLTNSR
jgi:CheY-like chemotaxis protein